MGAEVLLQVAENDAQLQLMQIENLLTQGMDMLIFNTIDES
jgi:ABC-type xylose transport system, periplasmic component